MYTQHLTSRQLLWMIGNNLLDEALLTEEQLLDVELELMDVYAEQLAGDLVVWDCYEYH